MHEKEASLYPVKMSQGPNILLEWLSKLHLAQYVESFLDNGYDDLEVCKQIGEPDLDAIGVHIEYHRHRLLSAVQKLRDEDSRQAPGYYFTLEPLHSSLCKQSSMLDGCGRSRSHPRGHHQPSCPGNHNLRVTDCNDFVTYPKLKLKVLIRDKLAKDGINLGEAPYTFKVSRFKRPFLESAWCLQVKRHGSGLGTPAMVMASVANFLDGADVHSFLMTAPLDRTVGLLSFSQMLRGTSP